MTFANAKINNTVKRKKMQPNKNEKNLFKLICDYSTCNNYRKLYMAFFSSSFARNMIFQVKNEALDKSYTKFFFIGLLQLIIFNYKSKL